MLAIVGIVVSLLITAVAVALVLPLRGGSTGPQLEVAPKAVPRPLLPSD
jgi:hypothetical protein